MILFDGQVLITSATIPYPYTITSVNKEYSYLSPSLSDSLFEDKKLVRPGPAEDTRTRYRSLVQLERSLCL